MVRGQGVVTRGGTGERECAAGGEGVGGRGLQSGAQQSRIPARNRSGIRGMIGGVTRQISGFGQYTAQGGCVLAQWRLFGKVDQRRMQHVVKLIARSAAAENSPGRAGHKQNSATLAKH